MFTFQAGEIVLEPLIILFYFFKDFIYLFLEMERERERGETHRCARDTLISCLSSLPQMRMEPATEARVLTRNLTNDLFFAEQCPAN